MTANPPNDSKEGQAPKIPWRSLRVWLGLIISPVLLYLSLRGVNMAEVGEALGKANYIYLVPVVLLLCVSYYLMAVRWKFLLEPLRPIGANALFPYLMVGYLVNNVAPARLGELTRSFMVGQRTGLGTGSTLATVVIEKVLDGLTLLTVLGVVLLVFPVPVWVSRIGLAALLFFGAATLSLYALRRERVSRLLRSALSHLKPQALARTAMGAQERLAHGLQVLREPRQLLASVGVSLAIWALTTLMYFLVFLSFDFALSPFVAVVLMAVLSFSLVIPSAPGFVGTFEFVGVFTLGLFAVAPSPALSLILVLHATQIVPTVLLGLACLWWVNLSSPPRPVKAGRAN